MSSTAANTLSRKHLTKLLVSVGTMASDQPTPSYTEHDWRACRFFNNDQFDKLVGKTAPLADIVSTVFSQVCQCDFTVSVKEVTQVNARDVMDDFNQADRDDWFLALGLEPDAACGMFVLPNRTAHLWAKVALGELEAEFQPDTALSMLETSLLYDLCKTLVESVRQMDSHLVLTCDQTLTTTCPVQWQSAESLLRITLSVQQADGQDTTESTLVLPCACYAPMVGKVNDAQEIAHAELDYTSALKEAIHQLRVPISAYLGTLSLTFQDLVSLKSNDILVLDKSIHQALDVVFSGKKIFRGVPGRHRGQLAVLITDS